MNRPPRYVINPVAAALKPMWFPALHQLLLDRPNKSYLNSLWVGTVSNLLTLPYRVATEIVVPFFNFRWGYTATAAVLLPVTVLVQLVGGICGRAAGLNVTLAQRLDSVLLSDAHGREALAQGCDLVVLDLLALVAQDRGLLPEGMVIPGHPPKTAA